MVDSLLLDTTYLLPLFGLESGLKNFNYTFRRLLVDYEVRYNPISLLEAKWLVLRVARNKTGQLQTFLNYYRDGLGAIAREDSIRQTPLTDEHVEELSDILLTKADLRDYFDRQIYSTAACSNYLLLTEDDRLHKLFRSRSFQNPKAVIKWKDVIQERSEKSAE
jgi:PIN domain nuclease of toxin-antitoxin system